jgi:sigma-B regulation protein RsbU (phosphoserine phosphatase)
MIAIGITLVGLLLLAYIVQRTVRTIVRLDAAHVQRQTVENELRIAHNIQMSMLRNDFPKELCATLQPMKEVGGDLYDFYQKDDNLYFIIGDVSGKGMPATMMMAATVNLFRMAARYFNTPQEIVEEINEVISERNPNLIFVTAFVGKLDMRHGLLTYCNAGHNPPIVNNAYLQTDPDIPIGYDAEYSFRQYGMLFPEGSRIVLYTDGVTESRNEEGDFMGTDYLLSLVQKHQQKDVSDLTRNIINDTHLFSEDADQRDDITLMCIANNISAQSQTLVISNDIEELQRVKPLVREYCECLGCDKRLTRKIVLALEEALANVINYAYPKGELGSIDIDILAMPAVSEQIPGDITFVISDSGAPFNPLEKQSVDVEQAMDDRQVGGLGIYLYQQLMDTVLYNRTDDGRNVLTLTKHISKV